MLDWNVDCLGMSRLECLGQGQFEMFLVRFSGHDTAMDNRFLAFTKTTTPSNVNTLNFYYDIFRTPSHLNVHHIHLGKKDAPEPQHQ